jgi:glucosamine-6-phosphate deaminase
VSNPSSKKSKLTVDIFENRTAASAAAAAAAAVAIRGALKAKSRARILVGTGNSQLEMIGFLTREPDIEWSRVEAFHLDEYVGISRDHPAGFRQWIRTRFADKVRPAITHYLEGDAADLDRMVEDYGRKLMAAPIDLAFVGIGENGHIAFNDPHVANFEDPVVVKRVTLDPVCRRQQVGEGHFPDINSMPQQALTVTCSGLFRAEKWICCVPDSRKAAAVKGSLEGPVTTACPGSLVHRHPWVALFLDMGSAALLSPEYVRTSCRVHGVNVGSHLPGR